VQVDHAEERLVVVLKGKPLINGAELFSYVKVAGGLDTGKDAFFHRLRTVYHEKTASAGGLSEEE
jgi:hypothetical protein